MFYKKKGSLVKLYFGHVSLLRGLHHRFSDILQYPHASVKFFSPPQPDRTRLSLPRPPKKNLRPLHSSNASKMRTL